MLYLFVSLYREEFHRSHILSFMHSLSEYNQLIILGDLNLPDINWSTLCGITPFLAHYVIAFSHLA